jgi:membrane-associated protease RseP (regulator of RpoE activity)
VEILLYVLGILLMVVALAVSIALHEIGHLVPAKLFRVRVSEFMIGFGRRIWSKKRGETEYGVKLLPLGGYIAMSGMYPPSSETGSAKGMFRTLVQDARSANDETIGEDDEGRLFYQLPVWKRIIIMLGGPLMNLLLAFLLFTLLLSGIGMQQGTTTIASISECVLPAGSSQTECLPSDPASPAAAAGLQPGDVLVSVAGTPVASFAESSAIVRDNPGRPLEVVVSRNGQDVTLTMTPIAAQRGEFDRWGQPILDENGEPTVVTVGFVGMSAQVGFVPQPITAGAEFTAYNVQAVAEIVVALPMRLWDVGVALFTDADRDPNGPLSVVGVGRLAGEIAAIDAPILNRIWVLLSLVASLNIALFVFNLIPLLPLDGGHVVVALWDGIKRLWAKIFRRPAPKPVDASKLVPVTIVVAGLLIGMSVLLIAADIFKPLSLL